MTGSKRFSHQFYDSLFITFDFLIWIILGRSSSETTLRYARITEERKREQHKKYLVQ